MGMPADELLENRKPDYIKIDVEGEERNAILGCAESIVKHSPALRIALYHKSADIFELPLMIHSINPDYVFNLSRTLSFPAWDIDLIATR
ncbi:MAG: FkbM family methyltransferase [Clostridia bacterium]|nr:FkbM family methyltransferase [Clostridia bacterium]